MLGGLWDDVQSTGFYCSQGLDPSTLSFLQISSVFHIFYWLDSDIGEVVVFLLKVSVQASLDPIGWSLLNISRMWVLNLLCKGWVVMPTYWTLHLVHVIT